MLNSIPKITFNIERSLRDNTNTVPTIITKTESVSIEALMNMVASLPEIDMSSLDRTENYVFAILTPEQISSLGKAEEVKQIWLNQDADLMMQETLTTIQAVELCLRKKTFCNDITWAVIDSGIDGKHPAFSKSKIVHKDYTGEGPQGGHGTAVAGILGGWDPQKPFSGVAPRCNLYNCKVAYSTGHAPSSLIIKAMEDIRLHNRNAGKMVIHGANISLGIVDEKNLKVYHPGQSPLCEEANRLMRSGVVVCIAAGSFGAQTFLVPGKEGSANIWANFEMITITDPGAAELPITVGSTHKKYPLEYGVSQFSSKGPTGDGRFKPDLVAPGEEIMTSIPENSYMAVSGTSAATAVVSGAAAQILHAFPKLIGKPMAVKRILMSTCKDLKRTRSFQGAGVINSKNALVLAEEKYD